MSNLKKKPHCTTSKNGHRTVSYPMADFAHFSTKNHAIKNTMDPKSTPGPRAQYGRAPQRSCEGWILEGGPSSQGTCDGNFLWRGVQQSSVWIPEPEAAVGSPFLYFRLNIFECAVAFFFAMWGGSKMNMMGIIIWKLIHCWQAAVTIHTDNDSEASSAYHAGPGTMVYP